MTESTSHYKEDWLIDVLDRLNPIHSRINRIEPGGKSTWTPCQSDPYFFDCSKCEITWTSCRLRSDPDLRIYQAYRRIGDPAAFASAGKSDTEQDLLSGHIEEILTQQGTAVTVGVLAKYMSTQTDDNIDINRVKSIVASTPSLDLTNSGMVTKKDSGSQRQQYLGPWWASHDVDSGQAIVQIQRSSSMADRKAQTLLFKHYQAYSLVQDCVDSSDSLTRAKNIISNGLDNAVITTGMSIHELVLIASSPDLTKLNLMDKATDHKLQKEVSKVLGAICVEELINKDPSIDVSSTLQHLKTHIVELNYPLVVGRAQAFARVGNVGFADLVQQGVLGLLRAIDKYDPYMGYQFSTYATWWITQSITREIEDSSRTVRIPVHVGEQIKKIGSAVRDFDNEHVFFPSYKELLDSQEVKTERLDELLEWGTQVVHLDPDIHDVVPSSHFDEESYPGTTDPALVIEKSDDSELIDSLLGALPDRDARVLRLRFGLEDGRPRTLEEIGGIFHLTRERIRQIDRKALARTRTQLSILIADQRAIRAGNDETSKWPSKVTLKSVLKTMKKTTDIWILAEDPNIPEELLRGLRLANKTGLMHLKFIHKGNTVYGILDPSLKLKEQLSAEWDFVQTGTSDSDEIFEQFPPKSAGWIFAENKQNPSTGPLFDETGFLTTSERLSNKSENILSKNQTSTNDAEDGIVANRKDDQSKDEPKELVKDYPAGWVIFKDEPKELVKSEPLPQPLDPKDPMSPVIEYFRNLEVEILDNRSKLGALWVIVDDKNSEFSKKLSDLEFRYLRKGVNATGLRPAWFKK